MSCAYPNLDGGSESSAQPVTVGGEAESSDDVIVVQGVKVLAFIQVPQHCLAVLASGCAQGTIRGNSHGVKVSGVANVVDLQLAVGQVPDLRKTIKQINIR